MHSQEFAEGITDWLTQMGGGLYEAKIVEMPSAEKDEAVIRYGFTDSITSTYDVITAPGAFRGYGSACLSFEPKNAETVMPFGAARAYLPADQAQTLLGKFFFFLGHAEREHPQNLKIDGVPVVQIAGKDDQIKLKKLSSIVSKIRPDVFKKMSVAVLQKDQVALVNNKDEVKKLEFRDRNRMMVWNPINEFHNNYRQSLLLLPIQGQEENLKKGVMPDAVRKMQSIMSGHFFCAVANTLTPEQEYIISGMPNPAKMACAVNAVIGDSSDPLNGIFHIYGSPHYEVPDSQQVGAMFCNAQTAQKFVERYDCNKQAFKNVLGS